MVSLVAGEDTASAEANSRAVDSGSSRTVSRVAPGGFSRSVQRLKKITLSQLFAAQSGIECAHDARSCGGIDARLKGVIRNAPYAQVLPA